MSHARDAERPAETPRSRWRPWLEVPVVLVVALGLALVVKTFLVQAYVIPSGSMQNTLAINDRVLVNKLAYHLHPVHRGDIVVFSQDANWPPETVATPATNPLTRALRALQGVVGVGPDAQTDFIKRVIAVGGDHVACCDAQGLVTVNGVALTEPYLYPGEAPSQSRFSAVVPAGMVWVMGDHRGFSTDSRVRGPVPVAHIIGRAFAVIWPVSQWTLLSRPATFGQPGLAAASSGASRGASAAPALAAAVVVSPWLVLRRRGRR